MVIAFHHWRGRQWESEGEIFLRLRTDDDALYMDGEEKTLLKTYKLDFNITASRGIFDLLDDERLRDGEPRTTDKEEEN